LHNLIAVIVVVVAVVVVVVVGPVVQKRKFVVHFVRVNHKMYGY